MTLTFTPKLILAALCASVLTMASCNEPVEQEATLDISTETTMLNTSGDQQSIEIKTNQTSWKATFKKATDWCMIKQEGNKLLISAQPQTSIETRSTQIIITAGARKATLGVLQSGANAQLTVDKQTITLAADGTAQTITIVSNLESWGAQLPTTGSWCTLKQSGNSLEIKAEENPKTTVRTTDISLIGQGLITPVIVKVSQTGSTPMLTIDKTKIELDAAGAVMTVAVTTNIDTWRATRPTKDSWCILKTTANTLEISAEISTVAQRTTTITVDDGAGALAKTITVTQKGGALSYQITIPTDFSECAVKKVMYNQTQIAEICLEYIQSQNQQMTVVYPFVDGKADLTQGVEISTGGSVVWNLTTNTSIYTAGTASNLTKVWVDNGKVVSAMPSTTIAMTTTTSDLLVDTRGASSDVYKIVKIGTQYWMAENLRAERYADGTTISSDWTNNTTGAYIYLYKTPADYKLILGALYNGYTTYNAAGLAPAGWDIPNNAAWSKLRTYIKTPYGTKLKSTDYWEKNKGTNITGFDARPAQNYSLATDFTDALETWFWSKDLLYDFLIKGNAQHYVRLVDTNTGMIFDASSNSIAIHSQVFGHSVRCIRK